MSKTLSRMWSLMMIITFNLVACEFLVQGFQTRKSIINLYEENMHMSSSDAKNQKENRKAFEVAVLTVADGDDLNHGFEGDDTQQRQNNLWLALHEHTDGTLILNTDSEMDTVNVDPEELNVVTLAIRALLASHAGLNSLIQMSYWFEEIARAWPRDVKLTENAKQSLEWMLALDSEESWTGHTQFQFEEHLDDIEVRKDDQARTVILMKDMKVKIPNITRPASYVRPTSEAGIDEALKTLKIQQIEKRIKSLITTQEIQGKFFVDRFEQALSTGQTLDEWYHLLALTLAIEQGHDSMDAYQRVWNATPIKNQVSPRLRGHDDKHTILALKSYSEALAILSDACNSYPRFNDVLRAVFYGYLVATPMEVEG